MNDTGIIHSPQTDAALGTSQIGKCDVNQLAGGQLAQYVYYRAVGGV